MGKFIQTLTIVWMLVFSGLFSMLIVIPDHEIFATAGSSSPHVLETTPTNGSSHVYIAAEVIVVFNESLNTSIEPTLIQTAGTDPGGWTFKEWNTTNVLNDTASWTHGNWNYRDHITLNLSSYVNLAGDTGDPYEWSFNTSKNPDEIPWRTFGHNMNRTGRSLNDTLNTDGTLKWSFQTGNSIYSSPAVDENGTIYFGSWDNKMYALYPNGTMKWSFSTSDKIYSPPTIGVDGTIFLGSWDDNLYAVEPNGSLKWSFKGSTVVRNSAAIGNDGTIYFGCDNSFFYALSQNGTEKWNVNYVASSSPTIDENGTIYIGSGFGDLNAHYPNGSIKWFYTLGTDGALSTPTIGNDGTIYMGYYDDNLYAIHQNGTKKWSFPTLGDITSSPSIGRDGTIFIPSHDGYLYSLNPNGSLKWAYNHGGSSISSPAIGADGTIYIGSMDHHIYALSPDGNLKWKYYIGSDIRGSPAIGPDGTVYIGALDGRLYAFGGSDPRILRVTPENNSTKVLIASDVIVVFNESMNSSHEPTLTQEVGFDPGGWVFLGWSTTIVLNDTATWTHNYWQYLDTITLNITGYLDPMGNAGIPFEWTFNTSNDPKYIPWQTLHHDFNRSGLSSNQTAHVDGTVLWKFTTGDVIATSPAIDLDGTIYIGSQDGYMYALYPNGTLKWKYRTGGTFPGIDSSPTIGADGTIYVGASDQKLYAFNPNGTIKWTYLTGGMIYSSPCIAADGTIYVGCPKTGPPFINQFYAITPWGELKWSYTPDGGIWESAAIALDGTIYVGSSDRYMYAFYPNGTLKWSYLTGGEIKSTPAIGNDGSIYFGSYDNKLYSLYPNGTLKWSFVTGDDVRGFPSIGPDGTIYIGSFDKNVYALNPNGTLKWNYTTAGQIYKGGVVIGADGILYFGSRDKNMYALYPDGSLKWKVNIGYTVHSSPAIGPNGTVYIGSFSYSLNAFGGSKPEILQETPGNNSLDVQVDQDVVVVFSECMNSSTIPTLNQIVGVDPGNWVFKGWSTTNVVNDTATWSHDNWNFNDLISLELSNYMDLVLETNLPYLWSFTTTSVDLYVTHADLSVDPSNPLDFGKQLIMNATVYNQGLYPVSNIPVKFYNGTPDSDMDGMLDPGAHEIGNYTMVDINGLGSANATLTWLPPYIGRYEIFIWVDPDNLTIETNEWNNTANISLEVYFWADDFRNETRISSMTNVTMGIENITLSPTATYGTLISVPISLPNGATWLIAHINKTDINTTLNIKISILNATNNQTIFSFENMTEVEINLSGIDGALYQNLRLKAVFTGNISASPVLHHWGIDWKLIDVDPPAFAGLVSAQDRETDGEVVLSWSPASDPSVPISYLIYQSTTQGSYNFSSPIYTTQNISHIVDGLTNGVDYWFVVRAADSLGNEDLNTVEKNATPTGPDNISPDFTGLVNVIDVGDGGNISLDWIAASDPDTPENKTDPHVPITYNIYISAIQGSYNFASPNHTTQSTSYTIQGLTNGINYWFIVRAEDSVGNEEGNTVEMNAIPTGPDDTPPTFVGLENAFDVGDGGNITLTWIAGQDPDTLENKSDPHLPITYNIYISTIQGNYNFASPNHTTQSAIFTVQGLTNGVEYWFVVRAADSLGNEEDNTIELNATPTTLGNTPPVFLGLTGAEDGGDGGNVTLIWVDASDLNVPITYNIFISTIQGNYNFASPNHTTAGTSFIVEGLENGVKYWFVVRAEDSLGLEETNFQELNTTPTGPDTTPPVFTGLVSATDLLMGDAVNLSWLAAYDPDTPENKTDPHEPIIYNIYLSSNQGVYDFSSPIHTTQELYYVVDGLTAQTEYWFVVRAADTAGNEEINFNEMNATPSIEDLAPEAPSGLTVIISNFGDALILEWTPNSELDIAGYSIYRSLISGEGYILINRTIGLQTIYTDSMIIEGTTYYYVISAYDSAMQNSTLSQEANVSINIAPATPTGLSATFYTTKTLNITWDANSEVDLVDYVLFFSRDGISFDQLISIPAGTEYYLHSGLQENTTYYYRLSARDEVPNESNLSEIASGFVKIETDGDGDPDIKEPDDGGFDVFILLITIIIVIISIALIFLFTRQKKVKDEPDVLDLETENTVSQNQDEELEESPQLLIKEKYPPPPPPPE
jgi:outer membrane protein assembly factor BamB/chitodextrinase